jgi:putative heme-binding domain-containing protein
MQNAALSATNIDLAKMFQRFTAAFKDKETEGSISFFAKLGEMMARSASSRELNVLLKNILSDRQGNWYDPIFMQGLTTSLQRNQSLEIDQKNIELLTAQFAKDRPSTLRHQSMQMLKAIGYFDNSENPLFHRALAVLDAGDIEEALLVDAILIIGWTPGSSHIAVIKQAFYQSPSPQVRAAVLESLAEAAEAPAVQDTIISMWPDLLTQERSKCISVFLRSDTSRKALLEAIVNKKINASSLSWPQTVSLLNSANHDIRSLARSVLQGNELNADVVWQEYEACLSMEGVTTAGAEVFKNNCSSCHQIGGKNGTPFGPDLAAIQNRNKPAIMLDILQPNKSIADGFELWTIETKSEEYFSGIISAQGPNTITIKDATAKETILERSNVLSSKVSEISAMPENLQTQLTLQDMANLLSYLKGE